MLGAQALGHDPRFATMQARREHRPELTAALDAIFETDTTSAWLARLQGRLPAAPVYNMEQALDNPFVERIGMIQATPHPQKPGFRALANPIKLDGQRLHGRIGSALGADTRDVLREIGYEDAEIDALASQRVI